jgi:hypothetical protein
MPDLLSYPATFPRIGQSEGYDKRMDSGFCELKMILE